MPLFSPKETQARHKPDLRFSYAALRLVLVKVDQVVAELEYGIGMSDAGLPEHGLHSGVGRVFDAYHPHQRRMDGACAEDAAECNAVAILNQLSA